MKRERQGVFAHIKVKGHLLTPCDFPGREREEFFFFLMTRILYPWSLFKMTNCPEDAGIPHIRGRGKLGKKNRAQDLESKSKLCALLMKVLPLDIFFVTMDISSILERIHEQNVSRQKNRNESFVLCLYQEGEPSGHYCRSFEGQ